MPHVLKLVNTWRTEHVLNHDKFLPNGLPTPERYKLYVYVEPCHRCAREIRWHRWVKTKRGARPITQRRFFTCHRCACLIHELKLAAYQPRTRQEEVDKWMRGHGRGVSPVRPRALSLR
jgi:hypothetical protein